MADSRLTNVFEGRVAGAPGPLDQRAAPGIGIRVARRELARVIRESREKGLGFTGGVPRDSDRVVGHDDRGSTQVDSPSSCFDRLPVPTSAGAGGRAMAPRPGAPASPPPPWQCTRGRAISVVVRWTWPSLVSALRTASSMAPSLTSPPSMCAMGMRRASATERARASHSDRRSAAADPAAAGQVSARPEVATPMVLAIPTIGIGAEQALDAGLTGKPSRSISWRVFPNWGRDEGRGRRARVRSRDGCKFPHGPIEKAVIRARSSDDTNARRATDERGCADMPGPSNELLNAITEEV